jgi:uncharacterized protein YbjT (DUF2867 family)
MRKLRVALTGGTGFVGAHLIRELLRRGHAVTALVRDPAGGGQGPEGLSRVRGDVLDPGTLAPWVEGADAVIHLVGIIRERGRATFPRVHVDGTRNVLAAARAGGVGDVVHMSALGARTDAGASAYHRTKGEAEAAVRESGLRWTIVRPSVIFGPGDEFVSMLARLMRFSPAVPMVGRGEFRLQPVWVGDVADAFAAALEDPRLRARTLEIGGPEQIPYREVLRTIGRVRGSRRLLVPVPVPFFGAVAEIGARLRIPLPITPDQLRMLLEENITDHNDLTGVIGRAPVGFEEGLRRYS